MQNITNRDTNFLFCFSSYVKIVTTLNDEEVWPEGNELGSVGIVSWRTLLKMV